MKVFISWSGQKSKAVGDLLDEWLQCVIQALDPWISTRNIDRGALWFSEITSQLNETTMGIICLTRENLNKPWILFEAGALAKGLQNNRICTFLIDIEPSDIQDPLAQFNHTIPNKDGVYSLVRTLNASLGEKALKEKILDQVFDNYWEFFEERFNKILSENPVEQNQEIRTDNDMLKELLMLTRNMDRRINRLEYEKIDKSINDRIPIITSDKRVNNVIPGVALGEMENHIKNGLPKREIINILSSEYNLSPSTINHFYNKEINRLKKENDEIDT